MANHPEIRLQFQADTKWKERFEWSCSRKLDVQIRADLVDADCVRRYHDAGVKSTCGQSILLKNMSVLKTAESTIS